MPLDTVIYAYTDPDWGDLLTKYDGKTITYDAIGNQLSDGMWSYTWEQGRQLASMSSGSNIWNFTYDANGMRTGRSNLNNASYTYVYNGSQLSWMNSSSGNMSFTYGADGSPLTVTYNGATYYYVTNLQGDVVAILNSSGTPVVYYYYDAWGRLLSTSGSMSSTLGLYNPLRYRGYVYDRETGLYYLQSRYYNPEWGRFINADSIVGAGDSLVSYNMFAYCGNNPVMGYDPMGTFDWSSFGQGATWLAVGITAVCVGVSVLTCGVAAPAMMAVAAVTVTAGTLTAVNGVSEIGEAATGHNFVRDDVFGGNETAYNIYANATAAVAELGTAICGGWLTKNAPRIKAYNNIQNYEYGDGAAKHIGQRSYYDSTMLKKQIIKYGNMTNEGNGVYTFRIDGSSFNAPRQLLHQGTWELTVINAMNLIGHFLLRY